jgi:hypothetical protein
MAPRSVAGDNGKIAKGDAALLDPAHPREHLDDGLADPRLDSDVANVSCVEETYVQSKKESFIIEIVKNRVFS